MRAYLTIEGAGKSAMKIQERLLSFLSCMVQYFLSQVPQEEAFGNASVFFPYQAIAKVCASWKLCEHSNGFRAKNF